MSSSVCRNLIFFSESVTEVFQIFVNFKTYEYNLYLKLDDGSSSV